MAWILAAAVGGSVGAAAFVGLSNVLPSEPSIHCPAPATAIGSDPRATSTGENLLLDRVSSSLTVHRDRSPTPSSGGGQGAPPFVFHAELNSTRWAGKVFSLTFLQVAPNLHALDFQMVISQNVAGSVNPSFTVGLVHAGAVAAVYESSASNWTQGPGPPAYNETGWVCGAGTPVNAGDSFQVESSVPVSGYFLSVEGDLAGLGGNQAEYTLP